MSTLVEASDIVGEDGRTKGGERQDVLRGLQNRTFCLARYPLSCTLSRQYIAATELVLMVNWLDDLKYFPNAHTCLLAGTVRASSYDKGAITVSPLSVAYYLLSYLAGNNCYD